MLAGTLAAAAPSISAAPAVAGNFGPGESDKDPHDPGALCHPQAQSGRLLALKEVQRHTEAPAGSGSNRPARPSRPRSIIPRD